MNIKTRAETVEFIRGQFLDDRPIKPGGTWHYGRVELRELLDFVYDSEPQSLVEALTTRKR